MGVGDVLSSIGSGLATAGRVAAPILERTAQVVSGEAPQIDQMQRQHQQAIEDADLQAKSQILENQLAMGQKYGTLTPEDQQNYIDQITQLYAHPRHAATLMEKLRSAIHPNGATYNDNPLASLPSAAPPGGTVQADMRAYVARRGVRPVQGVHPFQNKDDGEWYQPMYDAFGQVVNEHVPGYQPPPLNKAAKSPPVTGDRLPADAVGPDGQPIEPSARTAGQTYVGFEGKFWPVAKPKPLFKTVGGWDVLADPQTGQIIRKLAPHGQTKVTSHESLQPGDDGQMHRVKLLSVSTPEGANIDVEPDINSATAAGVPVQATSPSQGPATSTGAKKGVASALQSGKSTSAKPVQPSQVGGAGPVVPGMQSAAAKKLLTVQDRQSLESAEQVRDAIDRLMPILEKHKGENSVLDAAKMHGNFVKYNTLGMEPSDPDTSAMIKESALLGLIPTSFWTRVGRGKYLVEKVQQHLPKPTDTPALMYDKVDWLKKNVIPDLEEAIKNPNILTGQPNAGGVSGVVPKVGDKKTFPNGKTGTWDGTGWVAD